MGNTPCYYTLRSCGLHHGLHHGHHINSGHYTALIFNENTVLEIDDEQAHDRTEDWKSHTGSTVYLAFYSKVHLLTYGMTRIYYYDPMLADTKKERDVKLIKFYFEQFF